MQTIVAMAMTLAALALGGAVTASTIGRTPDSRELAQRWMAEQGLTEGWQAPPKHDVIVVATSERIPGNSPSERTAALPSLLTILRAKAAAEIAEFLSFADAKQARDSRSYVLLAGVTVARTFRSDRQATLVAIVSPRSIDLSLALRESREVRGTEAPSDPARWVEALQPNDLMQRFGATTSTDAEGRGCVVAFGMAPALGEGGIRAGQDAARESALAALRHFAQEFVGSGRSEEMTSATDKSAELPYTEVEELMSASPRPRALVARELRRWSATDAGGTELVGVVLCATPGSGDGAGAGQAAIDHAGGPHVVLRDSWYAEGQPLPTVPGPAALDALRGRGVEPGDGPDGRVAVAEYLTAGTPHGSATSHGGVAHPVLDSAARLSALSGLARELARLRTPTTSSSEWSHRVQGFVPLARVATTDASGKTSLWRPILFPSRLTDALKAFEGRAAEPDASCWVPATTWVRDASEDELAAIDGFRLVRDGDGAPCILAVGVAESSADDQPSIDAAFENATLRACRELARAFGGQVSAGVDPAGGAGGPSVQWASCLVDASLPAVREERRWVVLRGGTNRVVGVLVSCRLQRGPAPVR